MNPLGDEHDCELEQYIQERAKRNPDFPRMVKEARMKREVAAKHDVRAKARQRHV